MFHKLAVNQLIQELSSHARSHYSRFAYDAMQDTDINSEDSDPELRRIVKEVVDLSIKYQVLTEKTAFICVIQENNGTDPSAERQFVDIPNIENDDYSETEIDDYSSRHLGADVLTKSVRRQVVGFDSPVYYAYQEIDVDGIILGDITLQVF